MAQSQKVVDVAYGKLRQYRNNIKNTSLADIIKASATNSLLLAGILIFSFPLYYMLVSTSFATEQFSQFPPKLFFGNHLIQNFSFLIYETMFFTAATNTLIYATATTIGSVALATLAGYAFSMFTFPGRKPLFGLVLATLSIPFQLVAIPLFNLLVQAGLVNTYIGGILPAIIFPTIILMLKQNFDQLVLNDVINSGRIDGASEMQIFYHIVLPLLRPALAAATIIAFILRAGGLFWQLVIFRQPSMQTLTVFISQRVGYLFQTEWTVLMPAAALLSVPMILITIYFQSYFVKGLMSGSVK